MGLIKDLKESKDKVDIEINWLEKSIDSVQNEASEVDFSEVMSRLDDVVSEVSNLQDIINDLEDRIEELL